MVEGDEALQILPGPGMVENRRRGVIQNFGYDAMDVLSVRQQCIFLAFECNPVAVSNEAVEHKCQPVNGQPQSILGHGELVLGILGLRIL